MSIGVLKENDLGELLWNKFSSGLKAIAAKEIKKEVKVRKQEIHKQIGCFNRIQYFKIFNDMIKGFKLSKVCGLWNRTMVR
jgi:hypothetical protein